MKQDEEKELTKVLTDYKQKHDEFSKAMKKSRETFRMYEGEIKNLTSRVNELQQIKKKLMGVNTQTSNGGGKKSAAAKKHANQEQAALENPFTEVAYEKMQSEWTAEKEAMNKEKEELMQVCKEMQDKIKAITEAKQ